ncbi:MAG: hypothetical protein A3C90_02685 [Candidatus Magasanikbacteria bacterium RIFCSPHIGHO2_02_FULL_51_14]|uniref:Four helix bundle protein n=1 Tax=Candidatus Magasanikbacteria bacterium RIFCSPHIGHO2_02_FULL_51_14 TaxID=1798683 RepID=A0A1F6MPK9_9BACT|nr:MAG: hypothetical protein A3C90_02685 [Candidatus Magasanikbacteria bacterium RIFCSPHIGHO2_02_FULL_51_14]
MDGGSKMYNLEERTLEFSKRILRLAKALPKGEVNIILTRQFVRSGTSIGANYREANDALGDKDFLNRLRIARKEAKETTYWLELVKEHNPLMAHKMNDIIGESIELRKILSTMIINRVEKMKEK